MANALKFQLWLANEVLPNLRKYGKYVMNKKMKIKLPRGCIIFFFFYKINNNNIDVINIIIIYFIDYASRGAPLGGKI